MAKTGGVLGTLTSALKNPAVLGAGVGGSVGAGVGMLTGEDPNRFRNALVGGVTGASIGGLAGGLSGRGIPEGVIEGAIQHGQASVVEAARTHPEFTIQILESMDPAARKLVLKRFSTEWLTKAFGG